MKKIFETVTKKKRLVSILMAGVLAVGLAGCRGSSEDTTAEDTGSAAQQNTVESTDWRNSLEGVTLSFGTPGTYGPFTYFDEDGKTVIGYDIDLLNKLQELLGFEIDSQGIQTMDYAALTTSVAEGKLDMVLGALAATDERKEVMNFSDPYYESSYTLLVNSESSPEDITSVDIFLEGGNYKVACGSGTAAHLFLQSLGVPAENLDIYDDTATALQALETGKTDAMVYDNAGATYYINTTNGTKIEKAGEPFEGGGASYGVALSFDVCEEYPQLQESFSQAIHYLEEEGYLDELQKKWCE